ncbi:TPA: hypothetical protein ACGSTL_001268 [Vibrio parahaemolyticus]|uniref:hypothetical protein n=1 Tax=Vibrio campbellii TaxID=680 RepID=UPI001F0721B0|nr:hypothetical protein [Vibrio campbellii]UMM06686.1 hypothetical protein MKR81_27445 [Vibrio campbellii]
MKLYHYTVGIKLEGIISAGVIRTSPVKPKYPEKPIAWLSTNPVYEYSALKIGVMPGSYESRMMTLEEMEMHGKGLYRLVFDSERLEVEVLPWSLLRPRCKAKPKIIKRLLDRAKLANSNPEEWYGTLNQNLPIATASLEVATIKSDGKLQWIPVNGPGYIDSSRVLEVTVEQAKEIGLGLQCTDETWAQLQS